MLKSTFLSLVQNTLAEELWSEIETHYTESHRYYHNLHHLEYLLQQLVLVKEHISDWDTMLFSLYYHDIIYDPAKNDNEEQSAELAAARLRSLGLKEDKVVSQILATKGHAVSADHDTNLFTDADLSVLGERWNEYKNYADKIRKEYAIYPDLVYNPGRKKVLKHFMDMERIFKTDLFFVKLEDNAKRNLQKESEIL